LIKAEALNELSPANGPAAVALINTVRARVFNPAKPLVTTLTQQQIRDAILKERLFELTDEGKRRTDLIRMGRYSDPWSFKTAASQNEKFRILFPITQIVLGTNPLLEQNPGY